MIDLWQAFISVKALLKRKPADDTLTMRLTANNNGDTQQL